MAGWSCPDRNKIIWDGDIYAKNFIGNVALTGTANNVPYFSTTGSFTYSSKLTYIDSPTQLLINSAAAPTSSQLKIQSNSTGALSFLTYAADNCAIGFDTDWLSGSWYARDNVAFSMSKDTDRFKIRGNSGLTSGNTYSPSTRVCLTADGKFGLNIDPPTYNFHVVAAVDTAFFLDNTYNVGDGGACFFNMRNASSESGAMGIHHLSSNSARAMVVYNGTETPAKFKIYGNDGTGSDVYCGKMHIDNTYSYAYTATVAPSYALEVVGEVEASSHIRTTGGNVNTTTGVYECQSASGISTSFYVPNGVNSCFYDSDGDGVNDTWGYVMTGYQTVTVTGGIITSIV